MQPFNNGNFLKIVELLYESDRVIEEHVHRALKKDIISGKMHKYKKDV